MSEGLSGKIAIVTGASSGIGLSVAHLLAAAGAKVALVARTQTTLERAAKEVNAKHGADRAHAFSCDVGDFAALDALVKGVLTRLGGIDILVNNAGLNHRGPIARHSARDLADVITVNLTAPIYLTRLCADHLRPGGAVVNVASLAGMVPVPHEAAYCASKAGLRAFTRSVAEELAEKNVHVGTVCPGPVDTNFFGDIDTVPNLVFSQPMRSPDQIAAGVMECIQERRAEIAIPAASGKLATLGYLFPSLAHALRPMLEKRGAKNKARYKSTKGT
jgi:short-subunit dehydrogenase